MAAHRPRRRLAGFTDLPAPVQSAVGRDRSQASSGHEHGAQCLLPAPHADLHEDHSLTRQGQHIQPRQKCWNQRETDWTLLCQASAAFARDGEEPSELRGEIVALTSAGREALVSPVFRRGLELQWASRSSYATSAGHTKRTAERGRHTRE